MITASADMRVKNLILSLEKYLDRMNVNDVKMDVGTTTLKFNSIPFYIKLNEHGME